MLVLTFNYSVLNPYFYHFMWNFHLLKEFNEFTLSYVKCKAEASVTFTDMKRDLMLFTL